MTDFLTSSLLRGDPVKMLRRSSSEIPEALEGPMEPHIPFKHVF